MNQELETSTEQARTTATTAALNNTSAPHQDSILDANHTAMNTTNTTNTNTTNTTTTPNDPATNTPLNPVDVGPSKQLTVMAEHTKTTTMQPSPPESMIQSSNPDEQLYQFLTKCSTVKPTVPPTLTRRIMQKQGVGFVDPLVPKLISSCGDKFLATILSQAIICRDRRVKGELMKRKYERELARIAKRRKMQEMDLEKELKKKEEALDEFIKKKSSSEEAQETKKKKVGVHFTFHEKGGDEKEGEKDDGDDDLKQEEEYYASKLKAILELDGTNVEVTDASHLLDGKKQYLEDESDEEDDEDDDDDGEREMIQLVDVFRPLQAWGMSLVGKMGLASDPLVKNQKKKDDSDEEEEDLSEDENMGDLEEDEEETVMEGNEKTPARKKKKPTAAAASRETGGGGAKRKRSITPKPKSSPSSSGPVVKKTKISSEKD